MHTASEGTGRQLPQSGDWHDYVPLDAADPEPLPLDALPSRMARHVSSVAATTQTPTDAAVLLSLAALSIAIHGRARVVARSGWVEGLGIYAGLVMASGTRKSAIYQHVMEPLEAWEAEQARNMATTTARAMEERDVLEQRLRLARQQAARGEISMDELEAARVKLAEHVVPRARRLFASDATPEALPRLMGENDGCIAIAAPEGDPLRIAAGRYSKDSSPNLDVLKRAYSGESLRISRAGRPDEHVPRPSMVLAIALQPIVLETIANAATLRGEGLYGRVLWGRPADMVGHRLTGAEVPSLDEVAAADYAGLLRSVLEIEPADRDELGTLPHDLSLSPAAARELHALEAEVERRMGVDGDLYGLRDWAGKLCGQVVRIAGLLHLTEADVTTRIQGGTMAAAARMGVALVSHAQSVLGRSADPRVVLMRYVLDRLLALPAERRTVRELHATTRRKPELPTVEHLHDVLSDLESRELIRLWEPERGGPGRRSSPHVELHPDLCDPKHNIHGIRTIRNTVDFVDVRQQSDPLDVLRGAMGAA